MLAWLAKRAAGETVKLTVWRSGKTRQFSAVLSASE
jgi:S1-C subfamily serine protease